MASHSAIAGAVGGVRIRKIVAAMAVLFACYLPVARSPAQASGPKTTNAAAAPVVRVLVDPRVELLSVIFRLAGNPEYNQGKVDAYTKDVDEQFGPFRDHPLVKLARQLRQTRGVSYDACMSMAVHLTDASALKERIPFEPRPENLDERWPREGAREFLEQAREFVRASDFAGFIQKHQPLYDVAVQRMREVLDKDAHLAWFGEFFGARPGASFTVALGMLNGGSCYGPRFRGADGKEELYCVLGVWKTDAGGQPQFERDMLGTVVHEFCHSYANPLVEKNAAALQAAGEKMWPFAARQMGRQAYGNWKTMMLESLVRAGVVRYTAKYDGPPAARRAANEEKDRGFAWVGELAERLGEYEAARDKYPTLDAFMPRVVAFFDGYADSYVREQKELAAKRPKVVSMTPANGATDVDPGLTAITIVFDRPMKDKSWAVVGGGPHFPEMTGQVSYDAARKVLTIPVKLKPDWRYEFRLNSGRFQSFISEEGVRLEEVVVTFTTRPG